MSRAEPFPDELQTKIDAAVPIRTERLVLRRLTQTDIPRVQVLCNDQRVQATTLNIRFPYTIEHAHEWFEHQSQGWNDGASCSFGIVIAGTNELIGDVSLNLRMKHRAAMIGFYIGVSYWGNGYVTEAAHAALGFGFGVLGLNRIEAGHFAGNHASGRVQRKIGMTYEGTRRSYFVVRGKRTDDVLHAILREEYEPDLSKSIARAKQNEQRYTSPY